MNEFNDTLCRLDRAGTQDLGYRIYSIIWLILVGILLVTGCGGWFYYKQKLVFLSKRGNMKIALLTIALILQNIAGSLDRSVPGRESNFHSCPLLNLTLMLTLPYTLIGVFAQVLRFRNRAKLYNHLANNIDLEALSKSLQSEKASFKRRTSPQLKKRLFYASELFINSVVVFEIVLASAVALLITAFLCPEFGISDQCVVAEVSNIYIALFMLFFLIFGFAIVVYVRRGYRTYPDPFNILHEIKRGLIIGFLLGLPGLALSALDFGSPNEKNPVVFSYAPLIDAVFFWVYIYTVHYQIYKAMKFDNIKILYKNVKLNDILEDKAGRALFKAHLVAEFSLENLYFIEAVQDYKQTSPDKQLKKAYHIFTVFFKEQSINIPYPVSRDVKSAFEKDEINLEIFDAAYNEIWELTESDVLPRFQRTIEYENYVGLNKVEDDIIDNI